MVKCGGGNRRTRTCHQPWMGDHYPVKCLDPDLNPDRRFDKPVHYPLYYPDPITILITFKLIMSILNSAMPLKDLPVSINTNDEFGI